QRGNPHADTPTTLSGGRANLPSWPSRRLYTSSMAPPDERDVLRAVRRSRLPRTFPRLLPGEATPELNRPRIRRSSAHRSPTRQLIKFTEALPSYTPDRRLLSRTYSPSDRSNTWVDRRMLI